MYTAPGLDTKVMEIGSQSGKWELRFFVLTLDNILWVRKDVAPFTALLVAVSMVKTCEINTITDYILWFLGIYTSNYTLKSTTLLY